MNDWAKVDEALAVYINGGWGALTEEQKETVEYVMAGAWEDGKEVGDE